MKRLLNLLIIFLSAYGFSQNTILTGKEAHNRIQNSTKVRLKSFTDVPNYIKFAEDNEPLISEVFKIINSSSKNEIKLSLVNSLKDEFNMEHFRYIQVINGYGVEHAMYSLHTKRGKVISANGDLFSKLPNSKTATIPFSTALYIAKGYIGADIYKWEDPTEELFIKDYHQDLTATFMPKKELVYITKDVNFKNELRLAYKIDIYAKTPMSRTIVYIDAINGEILFENDLIHTADVTGTTTTGYSGNQTIITDSYGGSHRLRETGRGNGIETYDLNMGTSTGSAVDFTDLDNNWTNINPQLDEYATDAHWGAEMTYDYYLQVHNRNSIDGNGFKLKSYIHYDSNYTNAFWNGLYMTYGDGGAGYSPLTSMDIAGHEITHGLVSNTANLVYSYESGALNESFADIFGVSIDFWSRPTLANWKMGDEISTGSNYFRSMSDPNLKGDPDTYQGNYWHTSSSDNGGVHTNSGVQNYWYYLMCNGGNGTNDMSNSYNVTGIGMTNASKVAFRNLTVYLTSNSQYDDARFYAIQSAIDLFGPCSPEVQTTTKAWYAVGVGNDYVAGVQSDFTALGTIGCAAPFTISFTNLSNNATSFTWDFGDGNTSNQRNPSHTYTAPGTYNVQLYADGGACGNDTEIKTAFVDIDPSNPCSVIATAGSTTTQTACQGILLDDGGVNNSYSPNQNTIVTIAPTGASQVILNITSFDVEAFTNCGYDFLKIYDGIDTNATLIGKFCNTNIPPGLINSSGSSITIYFHSDPGLQLNGFQIDWNCVQSGSKPITQFTSNKTNACAGDAISFTNQTANGISYVWSFPGGNPLSSTQTNPTVSYNTPGVYNVQLIATNANGNDTTIKMSYITIDSLCPIILPAGGTYPTQTTCSGILFDDGGANSKHSPNQDTYITISPTGATTVDLNFIFFDLESGIGSGNPPCGYDYLEVFDGADTNATSLGIFCNGNTPPASLTSTGGSITLHFHSDPGEELQGFQINWQCNNTTELPYIEKEKSINEVNIFPNPTNSVVNIEVDFNNESVLDIKLIDLLGKIQHQSKSQNTGLRFKETLDLTNLSTGGYILYVNNVPHKITKN